MNLNQLLPALFRPRLKYWQRAEGMAADFLRKAGYTILDRNVRIGGKEIDIIALDGDTIVFVEVRSRHARDAVLPEDTVDERKERHIKFAADCYLQRKNLVERYVRFDIMAIILPPKGKAQITHLVDAFH